MEVLQELRVLSAQGRRSKRLRNKEGYKDPTAGAAIAHVRREEKRRRKKEERHEPSTAKKAITDAQSEAQA